jgi:hypothetical protein
LGIYLRISTIPQRRTIHGIVNKWRVTGSLLSKRTKLKSQVLTEEKLHETDTSIEHSTRKSLAHKSSPWSKLLKVKPKQQRTDTGIHTIQNEVPIHDSISGIWCSINVHRLIGLIFVEGTIYAERYMQLALQYNIYQAFTHFHQFNKIYVNHYINDTWTSPALIFFHFQWVLTLLIKSPYNSLR